MTADVQSAVASAWAAFLDGPQIGDLDGGSVAERFKTAIRQRWNISIVSLREFDADEKVHGALPIGYHNGEFVFILKNHLADLCSGHTAEAIKRALIDTGVLVKKGKNALWDRMPVLGDEKHYRLKAAGLAPDATVDDDGDQTDSIKKMVQDMRSGVSPAVA